MTERLTGEPTEEQLRRWYLGEQMSARAIGALYGRTSEWALIRLRRHGIPRRDHRYARLAVESHREDTFVEKAILERMYLRQRRSPVGIAKTLGVSRERVMKSLEHHGIPLREGHYTDSGAYLRPEEAERLYRKGLSREQIAKSLLVPVARVRKSLTDRDVPQRPSRGVRNPDLARRRGAAWEKVPGPIDSDGRPQVRHVLRLECGHKTGVRKAWVLVARKTDPTTITASCRACGPQDEEQE